MAIRDALWACPACRTIDAIRTTRDGEICSACRARFQPGEGAAILVRPPAGPPEARPLADWEAAVPPLDAAAEAGPGLVRATLRTASAPIPVRVRGELLGWAERFGPRETVTVGLDRDLVIVRAGGREERRPLADIVAVQPSSSSIQLRTRQRELISLAFPDSCVRLWEARLQAAVRRAYTDAGKGRISEFHPTIRAR